MTKPLPPLSWFRAFEAAARHASFTLAAAELGFTQSAISQHVRALEDRLHTKLFIRGPRSLQLTDAGRLLVPDVAAAMAQLERGTARFAPLIDRPKLTIATSASIAQWVLSPRLARFQQQYPDIALQLVTTIWPDDFATTNADIEIRFGTAEVVGKDAQLLRPSRLHLVAAPQIKDVDDWPGILRHPLIQPIGLSTTWRDLAPNRHPSEASVLVDTHGLAVDLAVNGAGIAVAHTLVTAHPIETGLLRALPIADVVAKEGYYLARKPTQHDKAQGAFIDWLLAAI